MGKYLSAGVYSVERDISELVPSIATTTAALVGWSPKGDVDYIKLITNKQQFIDEYGEPDNTSGNYFHYTALAFLEQGNKLWCLRVHDAAQYGGRAIGKTGSDSDAFSDLSTDFDTVLTDSDSEIDLDVTNCLFLIMGKDPGVWNSKISIAIDKLKNDVKSWDVGTAGDAADARPGLAEVDKYTFRIKVYKKNEDGYDELVETWVVSRKNKISGYGKQLYLEKKINGYSDYICVRDSARPEDEMPDSVGMSLSVDGVITTTPVNLGDGHNGTPYSSLGTDEIIAGWDEFVNPADVDIRILLNGGETAQAIQAKMRTIVEDRADCFAILDVDYDEMGKGVSEAITWRRGDNCNINSSYCAMYAPWVKINDPYNDVLIYVPPSGYVGAQFAYNDYVAQPWNAAAGFNRGMLNVVSMQDVFTEGERDLLYEAQINPLQTFRGEGDVIWGQKTMQAKSSALTRVQVRRLLIVIEKAMAVSLRPFVFENNTEITRFRIEAMLTEYLDLLSSQGAFQLTAADRKGYKVVVDDTNNTDAVVDRNELHCDVFIKPVRTAEFIQLQTITTTTGSSFDELIARGVHL